MLRSEQDPAWKGIVALSYSVKVPCFEGTDGFCLYGYRYLRLLRMTCYAVPFGTLHLLTLLTTFHGATTKELDSMPNTLP
jgi:hypothetical protein